MLCKVNQFLYDERWMVMKPYKLLTLIFIVALLVAIPNASFASKRNETSNNKTVEGNTETTELGPGSEALYTPSRYKKEPKIYVL